MKLHLRNANISAAIGIAILFVGGYLFHDSGEGPLLIVVVVAWTAMFWILGSLNERDERDQ
jgi:hypothetical protein